MCSAFLTNHSEANYFFFIAKTQEKSGRTGKRFAAGPWGAHSFCRHKTARHKRHNACDELFYIMGKPSTHSFCRLRVLFAQQDPLRWAPAWGRPAGGCFCPRKNIGFDRSFHVVAKFAL